MRGLALVVVAGLQAFSAAAADSLFLSLLSGTYREDQTLVMEALDPALRVSYALEGPGGSRFASLEYREPLRLSALPGEERDYKLSIRVSKGTETVQTRDLRIVIDRLPPAVPPVDPDGGSYERGVAVSFKAPAGTAVYYAVNRDILTQATRWDGRAIEVDTSRGDQLMQYYAMDEAGNRSDIASQLYTRLTRDRALSPRLEIVSPAEGAFANQQLLYLISEDVGTIRYTLDGSDPTRSGSVYTEPRVLEYSGSMRLRVAAYPVGSDRDPIVQELVFSVEPEREQSLVVTTPSGVYPDDRAVEVLGQEGVVFYTNADVAPDDHSLVFRAPLRLASTPGTRRISILRARLYRTDGTWGGEYRFCYILDRRTPPAPTIEVLGRQPSGAAVTVRIDKDAADTVRYTLDGSDPGPSSPVYSGAFPLEPAASGTVIVKAVAAGARGAVSSVVERRVVFDTVPPRTPDMEVSERAASRAVRVSLRAEQGSRLVQEVAGSEADLKPPTASSIPIDGTVVLDVPLGYRKDFYVRFAAVDDAGNVSVPTDVLHVLIDKVPPECPPEVLALDGLLFDQAVALRAPSALPELYYEVRDDGSVPPDPSLLSPAYEADTGLTLEGSGGERVSYAFKALLRDELGNTSDVYGPFTLTVDRRLPVLPQIEGVADGQRVSDPFVVLRRADAQSQGVRVAYTYTTDGSTPETPGASSRMFVDELRLDGIEGSETVCTLLLLPMSASGNLVGEAVPLRFVIDRRPPSLPTILGVSDGERSGKPLTATLVAADSDDELFYSISAREEGGAAQQPEDPIASGRRYTSPITLDAETGHEPWITLRVAARDRAGNRSVGDALISVVVDKRAPDAVKVSGLPPSGVSRDPVTITMASAERQILYEMTDDGSVPAPPGTSSASYISPIVVSGRGGQEIEYRFRCRAVDDVGNVGPATAVHGFAIDRKPPAAPPMPSAAAMPTDASRFILAWPDQAAYIHHRLLGDTEGGAFRRYGGPFEVAGQSGRSSVDIECYSEDAAGNRSATVRYSLSAARRLAEPAILGADQGAVYPGDRVIVFDAPAGEVLYEMTLDGTLPAQVSRSSRSGSEPVELAVPDGATVDVAIRARAFPADDLSTASTDTLLRFRIDKTPPEAPSAEGVADGGFYRGPITVGLLSTEGTIYCAVEAEGKGTGVPDQTEANRYRDPITLRVDEGRIARYRLVAYTVDEAGNRSWNVRAWNITLDDKTIHVAETGDDRAAGTRDKPLRSLTEAVRAARASSRKEIHAALGTYVLDDTLVLSEGLTLIGGFAQPTWEPAGLGRKTTVTAAADFGAGSLVTVTGGAVRVSGFRFTHPAEVAPMLIAVRDGEARVEDCAFLLTKGDGRIGVDVAGGKLTLTSSELEADDGPSGSFVRSRGGVITLSSSTFRGPRTAASFAAIAVQQGSSAALSGLRVDAGGAQRTDGVLVEDSEAVLSRCVVESGAAGAQGAAVRCVGSRVEVTDCTLSGTPGAMYSSALSADASAVTVRASILTAAARAGAIGIRARGGEILVERCRLVASETGEFAYLADLDGARARLFTNIMAGAGSGDSVVGLLSGGASDWFNNTIVAGTGNGLTAGLYVTGVGEHRIINNILVRKGADAGVAIIRLGEDLKGLTVLANNLSGWSHLASTETGNARAGRLVSGGSRRIDGIDELNVYDGDRSGGPIASNIREAFLRTFKVSKQEDFHLSPTSQCVDRGVAVDGQEYAGPTVDMDGEGRPAPMIGSQASYDIGADELR